MTDLEIIEHHQQRVLEAFRSGEFDQIEIIGEGDAKEFFERCFREKILEALAGPMPMARKKEEVPLWFDEHNHPVDYDKLSAAERQKAPRERCYKLVSLGQVRGDSYEYAAAAVVPGNAHECPVLYQLVAEFVRAVGLGVLKLHQEELAGCTPGLMRRRLNLRKQ
ncbi:MAG: hypothetical protein AAB676_15495 [Verrucomicrobiota bacterium]